MAGGGSAGRRGGVGRAQSAAASRTFALANGPPSPHHGKRPAPAPLPGSFAMPALRSLAPLLILLALSESLQAAAPHRPRYEHRRVHDPDGIGKFYMGREIAYVMGHLAADWLDRPPRVKEERPDKPPKTLAV